MRSRRSVFALFVLFICGVVGMTLTAKAADDAPRMTSKELKNRLGDSDLVIVDVRAGGSWSGSESKIKGAVREDPGNVQDWIKKYPRDKTIVFYCS